MINPAILEWRKLVKAIRPSYVGTGNNLDPTYNPLAFWFDGQWYNNVELSKRPEHVAADIACMRAEYEAWTWEYLYRSKG